MTSVQLARRRGFAWMTVKQVEAGDLRSAGVLMLILAFLRPLMPFDSGVLCPLRATTGVPCPLCGMTTSVTAATHFDFSTALSANPAGIIAVLVAAYLLIRRPRYIAVSPPLVVVGLGAMWIFELNRYGII